MRFVCVFSARADDPADHLDLGNNAPATDATALTPTSTAPTNNAQQLAPTTPQAAPQGLCALQLPVLVVSLIVTSTIAYSFGLIGVGYVACWVDMCFVVFRSCSCCVHSAIPQCLGRCW